MKSLKSSSTKLIAPGATAHVLTAFAALMTAHGAGRGRTGRQKRIENADKNTDSGRDKKSDFERKLDASQEQRRGVI